MTEKVNGLVNQARTVLHQNIMLINYINYLKKMEKNHLIY
ncbi:MAG: hypothetical protein ACJAQ1_001209 [Flavobacterium sp.]|jgi:hypothetical protein